MKYFLISSLSFFSIVALATQPKYTTVSPFADLKERYESASSPAVLADFDEIGKPSNMRCAGSSGGQLVELFVPKVFTKGREPDIPARPPEGPLFPGQPAVSGAPIQILASSNWEATNLLSVNAMMTRLETTNTDLVSLYNDVIWWPGTSLEMQLRKSGDYIFSKITNTSDRVARVFYAYCWRE